MAAPARIAPAIRGVDVEVVAVAIAHPGRTGSAARGPGAGRVRPAPRGSAVQAVVGRARPARMVVAVGIGDGRTGPC